MPTVSSRVLSLSAEAAILVRAGRIAYANARAEKLIGSCVGKALREVFSAEIAGAQAGVFSADTTVSGKRMNVRTAKLDDMQVFFLSEQSFSLAPVSDAFLYSVRSALMNLRLSQDLCRARAEKMGDSELTEQLRSMQRGVFSIARLLENASRYGFVLRYPEGKEKETGMDPDPAVFRYVGIKYAKQMKTLNMCLDEYTAYLASRN